MSVEAFASVRRMLCPEVVGRSEEISWLGAALDGLSEGRGGALFLLGEPGIGKSRLVGEAEAEGARRGVWVLSGRATPTGGAVPYQSVSGAVLSGLRERPLKDGSDLSGVRPGLAALLPGFVDGPTVEATPTLIAETVLRLATSLGGRDGALVVLEDLHWACGDTLAVSEYLADNAALQRLLVLGTSRPESAAFGLISALERRGSAEVRTLAPLSSGAVGQMTVSCLASGGSELSATLSDLLSARAEGLPFLVEELLAGLVNRGTLAASDSGWQLAGELELDVPLSFAESVRERLALLSPQQRLIVEIAALLGRDFDWSHLPKASRAAEADVLDALSRAVDLQLVEETGGARFRFRHALTVDAILDELLLPQRARLASRVLEDLVEDPQQVPADLLELAAHLAAQAGRKADAARYLTEHARRALSSGALATATATARRARRLAAGGPEAIAAGEVLLAALSQAGDMIAVDEVGSAVLAELAAADGSAERRARVLLLLAKGAHVALDLARARELCEQALGLTPPDTRLQLELDLALAEIAFSERQHAAATAGAEAVLADADRGGHADLACDALKLLGRQRMYVAFDLRGAEPYLLEALRRAEQAQLPLARLRTLQQLAFRDFALGHGRARIDQGRALAEELGALASVAEFDHLLTTYQLVADQLDEAADCAERALAQARRYRLVELTARVMGLQAIIAAARGDRAKAEQLASEAASAAEPHGPFLRAAVSGTPMVVAALASDDLAAAALRVSETRKQLADEMVYVPPPAGSFYGVAAVVQAASGATELVEGRDWVASDDVYQRSSFCIAKAIVAGRAGDRELAEVLFAEGDESLAAIPWVRALYRRYAGEAAISDGWGEPTRWLAEAETYLVTHGNEPLARACRSLLRLAGTSPRRQRAAPSDIRFADAELTTREVDVLSLLAEGLTNKEIAARLYLSPRTVEKHVERILAKTGQTNRTALAAFASERQAAAAHT